MAPVKPGDPLKIAADDWNVMLGVADAARRGQLSMSTQPRYGSTPYGVIVPVKNGTGSDVSRFNAMAISGPIITYSDNAQNFKNEIAFDGATMSSSYLGKFAVAQETIASGKIGACLVSGVTQAEITVGDANHTHVDVDTAGGAKLVSAFGGAGQILWKESGTGTKWALIRVGTALPLNSALKQHCRFTLGAALATTDATKSATIQTQYGPGADHASTSITVRNLLTHTAGTYVFEGDSGDAGLALYDTGTTWNIIQMECP